MSEKIVQTAGRSQLGGFAPMFAHLNDDVLFGEVWNEESIDVKTRCISELHRIILVRREVVILNEPLCRHRGYEIGIHLAQTSGIQPARCRRESEPQSVWERIVYLAIRRSRAVMCLVSNDELRREDPVEVSAHRLHHTHRTERHIHSLS